MFDEVFTKLTNKEKSIGVIGLGYVGLPIACLFAAKFRVVGFDVNKKRVSQLSDGVDLTKEIESKDQLLQSNLTFTTDPTELKNCSIIIVAVPTPVDEFKVPDLSPLEKASTIVGQVLPKGAVVVYESTVYPGVTEQVCGPILSKESGFVEGREFYLGYSPERVVPGDKERTIDKIIKIVAGSSPDITNLLAKVYGEIIPAGIHRAPNIRTAEAAKVIENCQRDLNIALVNELSVMFDKIGLDTLDVLEAAGTKWNFLPFRPGLVGGHCIGVDPYYLTHLSKSIGFHTQVISAGRMINDTMGEFVAEKAISMILNAKFETSSKVKIAIMGVTFKENVPDIRNTKIIGLAKALEEKGAEVFLLDPVADVDDVREEYGLELVTWEKIPKCDAIIVAVPHKKFMDEFTMEIISEKLTENKIILDLKGCFSREEARNLGINIWRL